MKYTLWISLLLTTGLFTQANQAVAFSKSIVLVGTYQSDQGPVKNKKRPKGEPLKTNTGMDSTSPQNRKQRRLNPDSLRRGGATKVDTVRR
ncbi:hypothetical protein BH09BAC4_BH09BAC4_23100 [soil metagenome]